MNGTDCHFPTRIPFERPDLRHGTLLTNVLLGNLFIKQGYELIT